MKAKRVAVLATQLISVGLLLASCSPGAPAIPPSKTSQAPQAVEPPAAKPSVAPTAPSPAAKPVGGQPRSGGGNPIPGLYGSGELGSVYGMLYPGSGGHLTECFAFGRIAGENAAREKSHI